MDVTFGLPYEPIGDRRASPSGHRVKARSSTLGTTRWRLIQVLRHLGLFREEIEGRLREEQERNRALERERSLWLEREEAQVRLREQESAARLAEEQAFARFLDDQRTARMLREKRKFEAMTPEQ
jgi:hypothetical protein